MAGEANACCQPGAIRDDDIESEMAMKISHAKLDTTPVTWAGPRQPSLWTASDFDLLKLAKL
jgi:hypothetical protein